MSSSRRRARRSGSGPHTLHPHAVHLPLGALLIYYRKAGGVMIVYDSTSRASFEGLPKWLRQVIGPDGA